jgi:hypothetical protein
MYLSFVALDLRFNKRERERDSFSYFYFIICLRESKGARVCKIT